MRVLRILLGLAAVFIALPLLTGGAALWEVSRHRAADGSFSARLETLRSPGYAIVVPNVDTLLRSDAAFTRGDRTSLRVTARTATGPAFIGLAPFSAVAKYLDGVSYTTIAQVRLARGPLPVTTADTVGPHKPVDGPATEVFWVNASGTGTVVWYPDSLRGQRLALVVMDPAATVGVQVNLTAAVRPAWLAPTTWGLGALGLIALALGLVLIVWPGRRREVVFVVEPGQVPELRARLGLRPPPVDELRDGTDDALGLFPPPPSVPAPPAFASHSVTAHSVTAHSVTGHSVAPHPPAPPIRVPSRLVDPPVTPAGGGRGTAAPVRVTALVSPPPASDGPVLDPPTADAPASHPPVFHPPVFHRPIAGEPLFHEPVRAAPGPDASVETSPEPASAVTGSASDRHGDGRNPADQGAAAPAGTQPQDQEQPPLPAVIDPVLGRAAPALRSEFAWPPGPAERPPREPQLH